MELTQREELVRWAQALERSDADDVRAAGRAILTLCEANSELRRGQATSSEAGEPTEEPTPVDRRELERWAQVLSRADLAVLRAAGRAIRGLCAEHESLERALEPASAPNGEIGQAAPRPARAAPRLPVWWRGLLAVVGVLVVLGAVFVVAGRAAALDPAPPAPSTDSRTR